MLETFGEQVVSTESRRLGFRPCAPSDCWPLARDSEDEQFARYIDWPADGDPERAFRLLEDKLMRSGATIDNVSLSAWMKPTDECPRERWVGLLRFYYSESPNFGRHLHFGVWLSPQWWGHPGLAIELGRFALDSVWNATRADTLLARVVMQNLTSQRCLRHLGFASGDSYRFDTGERQFDVRELHIQRAGREIRRHELVALASRGERTGDVIRAAAVALQD